MAAAEAHRREFVGHLSEAREQHFKGEYGAFRAWLVEDAHVGRTTAERAPELLDHDYDDEAWFLAILEDLVAVMEARSKNAEIKP